jgi:hypothetical protein
LNPQTATIVRLVLALAGMLLVSKGFVPQDAQDTFVGTGLQVVGGLFTLGTLFTTARHNERLKSLVNYALALPVGSTALDLDAAARAARDPQDETPARLAPLVTTPPPAVGGGNTLRDYLIRQALATVTGLVGDLVMRSRFRRPLLVLRDALNSAFPVEPAGGV